MCRHDGGLVEVVDHGVGRRAVGRRGLMLVPRREYHGDWGLVAFEA